MDNISNISYNNDPEIIKRYTEILKTHRTFLDMVIYRFGHESFGELTCDNWYKDIKEQFQYIVSKSVCFQCKYFNDCDNTHKYTLSGCWGLAYE